MYNNYTEFTRSTAVYPRANTGTREELNYLIHGLTGESGEISNFFKKILRKDELITNVHAEKLADELGDVLWYCARIADALGYSLEGVMNLNMDKLSGRKADGTLTNYTHS
jgi:NTP pyrophosphatase (non-canonical NTP hydrolase)